jgi:hypothetical protein
MAIAELKEALTLLRRMPVLWTPGIVGGSLTAAIWILYNLSGAFFAGRLAVFSGLVLLIFTTGMLTIIRKNEGTIRELVAGGIRYYFQVLLPLLVIISGIILVFILITVTFSLFGISDVTGATALAFGFMIPTLFLTFFSDTAAVFEDRRVFESIRRSMQVVFAHVSEVIVFLLVCMGILIGVVLAMMIVWEAFLYDKLEPLSRYNETQLQTLSPDQLLTMIGPGGTGITAVVLFFGIFLLIPILYSYKACFFRKLASGIIITQQPTTGEFDSKGRWYKY